MGRMSDVEAESVVGSPFWRFSLAFYRRPAVASACLELQDGCGVDVNLLLFLLWLALARRQVTAEDVRAFDARVRHWRESAIMPLRSARRALKGGTPLIDATTAELFRNRIKAMEIEAERLAQEALYGLAQGGNIGEAARSAREAARANIAAYQAAAAREFPDSAVEALLAALSEFEGRGDSTGISE